MTAVSITLSPQTNPTIVFGEAIAYVVTQGNGNASNTTYTWYVDSVSVKSGVGASYQSFMFQSSSYGITSHQVYCTAADTADSLTLGTSATDYVVVESIVTAMAYYTTQLSSINVGNVASNIAKIASAVS